MAGERNNLKCLMFIREVYYFGSHEILKRKMIMFCSSIENSKYLEVLDEERTPSPLVGFLS